MQHQIPCNRRVTSAALDFAVPSPPTLCLGGGFHSPFNLHTAAPSSPAEGSLPQGFRTGSLPSTVGLPVAYRGTSQYLLIRQLGIAFSLWYRARQASRQVLSFNPTRSAGRIRQAHSQSFMHLSEPEKARQMKPLAVEPRPCDAGFHPSFDEPLICRWTRNRASPSAQKQKQKRAT